MKESVSSQIYSKSISIHGVKRWILSGGDISVIKRILLSLLLSLGICVSAHAQGGTINDIVLYSASTAVGSVAKTAAGALVTVCPITASTTILPCAPKSTIYTDYTLTTVAANPVIADNNGNYSFSAIPGQYVVTFTGRGLVGRVQKMTVPGTVTMPGTSVDLQTNGVSNTLQTTLNLKNGSGITLTSDGLGGVTFDLTGSAFTTCSVLIGSDNGDALVNGDISPQRSQCNISFVPTIAAVIVMADAGASTIRIGGRHNNTAYNISPVLTPATVAGITDKVACANTAGTPITIEGVSVTCTALTSTSMFAGDWIETVAGTADTVTKRLSTAVIMTGNTGGSGGGGSDLELQTNGVDNGSQTLLNLAQGSGIILQDNGSGRVLISSTGLVSGTGTPFPGMTPWSDITNTVNGGAVCNAATDGSAAFAATIAGMNATGGTTYLPNDCKLSPGILPFGTPYWVHNIGLGGRLNLGATLSLPATYGLTCMPPSEYGYGSNTCTILPATGSDISPVLKLEFRDGASGPHYLKGVVVSTSQGSHSPEVAFESEAGVAFWNIDGLGATATQIGDTPAIFHNWGTVKGCGFSSATGDPGYSVHMRGLSGASFGGSFECSLLNGGGFIMENEGQSMGTINGLARWVGQTFHENVTTPFLGINTWGGGGLSQYYIESVGQADPLNDSSYIDVFSDHTLCPSCVNDGQVDGGIIINPQPTFELFHNTAPNEEYGLHTTPPVQDGAVVINTLGNKLLGAYGIANSVISLRNGMQMNTNPHGYPAFVSTGIGTPIGYPYQTRCIASTTGGTIPAGTYYLIAAHVGINGYNGGYGESLLGEEVYVTTTGTTSSIGCDWVQSAGATDGTRIYMGTSSHHWDRYFLVAGATNSISITNTTGTPGTSIGAYPMLTYNLGLTNFISSNGTWLGLGSNVGIGMLPSSRKLDVTGTFGATGAVTFGSTLSVTGASTLAAVSTTTLTSTGAVDFNTAPSIKLPVGAGAVTTANGNQIYDSTNKNWHIWSNGNDYYIAVFDPAAITNGHCAMWTKTGSYIKLDDFGDVCGGGGGGGTGFSDLTNGTNSTAAMIVGTGASLSASGSGTIHATLSDLATALAANPADCSGGQFANAIAANGDLTCATPTLTTLLFSGLTSATNTTATMHVGTGASLDATGSGSIHATLADLATAASALAANPTDCSTDQFANAIAANGNLTCAQVAYSQLSGVPSTIMFTDASFTYGAFNADFSGASLFKIRVAAGATVAVNGSIAYDSTANNYIAYQNGVQRVMLTIVGTPSNNDCLKAVVSGSVIQATSSGVTCIGLPDPGSNGLVARTASNTTAARTLQQGLGMSITNPGGVSGDPIIALNTDAIRRQCGLVIGNDDATSALVNTNLGPQGRQCFVPTNATVVEIDVNSNGGTPTVLVGRNRTGVGVVNLTSAVLSTAVAGAPACSNAAGGTGIDGTTTCSATLQNITLNAGDWIELESGGVAGGTAKRMSVTVVYILR
jgi:hypothetical protein